MFQSLREHVRINGTQTHLRGLLAASQAGVVVAPDAHALCVRLALAVAGARHRTAAPRATNEPRENRGLVTVHRTACGIDIVDDGLPHRARDERFVRVLDDDALAADRALEPADVERRPYERGNRARAPERAVVTRQFAVKHAREHRP